MLVVWIEPGKHITSKGLRLFQPHHELNKLSMSCADRRYKKHGPVFKSHLFGNKTVVVSDPMQICRSAHRSDICASAIAIVDTSQVVRQVNTCLHASEASTSSQAYTAALSRTPGTALHCMTVITFSTHNVAQASRPHRELFWSLGFQ